MSWHAACSNRAVRRCLSLLVLSLALGRAHGSVPVEFPFEYREGLLWIKVQSDLSPEALNFIVDSGAAVTSLNLDVAKRIGLQRGTKVPVQGVHTTLSGYLHDKVSLKCGAIKLPSRCLAIDLSPLSCSCKRSLDGLLGADFFQGRITEVNFAESRIRVLDSAVASEFDTVLPLDVRSCGMRVPLAVNEGKNNFFRLDTGCASDLQWVTSKVPEQCAKKVAIGLSQLAIPQATTKVRLGNIEFEGILTGLHKTVIFPGESGLLGNGILSRFSSVVIDARGGQVLLRPSK